MAASSKSSLNHLKSELSDLSTRIHTMEKLTRDIGGPRDGEGLRRKLRNERDRSKGLVRSLSHQLPHAAVNTSADRALQRKLQTNFKELLRRFESVAEDSLKRERKATLITLDDDNPSPASPSPDSRGGSGVESLGLQEVRLNSWQASTVETEEAQAREKQRELLDLETDLNELHSCYVEFATMVDEQEGLIDDTGKDVQKSTKNMERGVTEVRSASKYQKRSRKLMCLLIIILVAVIAAVVIAIVLGVKFI
eukprot:gb/GECH01007777.1/.p1 GENE.gb/GECH01007777.1/~~gb/GECH01007777.1/.p1  ORF type:complete len:252 (+),score=41.47 gb/GECH01007777.1/:1-756(+)